MVEEIPISIKDVIYKYLNRRAATGLYDISKNYHDGVDCMLAKEIKAAFNETDVQSYRYVKQWKKSLTNT